MIAANRPRLLAALFLVLMGVGMTLGAPAPRVLAGCDDTIDTTDSFSMNCVPTMIPDVSDQITEAEVASPGWNAGTGAPGSGVRR